MQQNPVSTIIKLTRFPLAITASADSVAGYLLTASRPDISKVLLFAGASFCLYSGGVVLNDIVDSNRDKTLHPERPIPSGKLSRNTALLIANILLILGLFLATLTSRFGFFCGIAIANLIIAYNYGTKHLGIFGALNMALTRGLNLLMGGIEVQSSMLFSCSGILAVYIFLVTCISLLEENKNVVLYRLLIFIISVDLISINFIKLNYLSLVTTVILSLFVLERINKCWNREQVMTTVKNGVLQIIALDAAFVFSGGTVHFGFIFLIVYSFLYLFRYLVRT